MRMIKFLAAPVLLLTLVAVILWLARYPVAAAVVITLVVGLGLFTAVAFVWSAASWWTTKTMERGAEIALRAQQVNDAWDAQKTTSLVQLVREAIKVGRLESSGNNTPALPLPSQEMGWLPALSSFNSPFNQVFDQSAPDEIEQTATKFSSEE